jgi:hypothetical protein
LRILRALSQITVGASSVLAKPVLLVTLFSVPADGHAEIVQVICGKFSKHFRIVFCITEDDFSPFLRKNLLFETFPSIDEQRARPDLIDWPSYLNGKWALVVGKWKPEKILAYGMNFNRYLDASRSATFRAGSS